MMALQSIIGKIWEKFKPYSLEKNEYYGPDLITLLTY